jgi:hypothetical protein
MGLLLLNLPTYIKSFLEGKINLPNCLQLTHGELNAHNIPLSIINLCTSIFQSQS